MSYKVKEKNIKKLKTYLTSNIEIEAKRFYKEMKEKYLNTLENGK